MRVKEAAGAARASVGCSYGGDATILITLFDNKLKTTAGGLSSYEMPILR